MPNREGIIGTTYLHTYRRRDICNFTTLTLTLTLTLNESNLERLAVGEHIATLCRLITPLQWTVIKVLRLSTSTNQWISELQWSSRDVSRDVYSDSFCSCQTEQVNWRQDYQQRQSTTTAFTIITDRQTDRDHQQQVLLGPPDHTVWNGANNTFHHCQMFQVVMSLHTSLSYFQFHSQLANLAMS